MLKKFLLLLTFIFSLNFAFAQNTDQIIEDLVEEIAANSDQEVDISTIYDDLYFYLNNPLNLNEATKAQLKRLHFLNDLQINQILEYRKKYGNFLSVYELQLLNDFSYDDIKKLLPFITVEPPEEQEPIDLKKALKYGRNQVFARTKFILQPQKGYIDADSILAVDPTANKYLGNPFKYYLRYKYQYRDRLMWGFTAEKDPGEQFFRGAQKYGFDYYSAHIQVNKVWKFEKIVLGDYQLQFGEGLVLWTGMSFGKSSMVLNIKKKPQGIKKYSSTDENRFLRGIAATYNINEKIRFSAFFSSHKVDGNIVQTEDTTDQEQDILQITSLQTTGYHRTPSEVADRHTVRQTLWGANVSFHSKYFKTGLTFADYYISADLIKDPKPYQIYDFQGNNNFNLGLNYTFSFKDLIIFGENAISKNLASAHILGIMGNVAPQLSVAWLYRYFEPQYQAYFANAFSEGTKVKNEKGFYLGFEFLPAMKFKFSSYIDVYQFPWLKFRLNQPQSYGVDFLSQLNYSPSRYVSMYWKFKRELKEQNISDEAFIKYPVNTTKWYLRYHISYAVSKTITLRNRLEISGFEKDNKTQLGYLIYQDVKFVPKNYPLTFYFRYAVFDAPYDARIYAYENDVLYAFSVPGYFYKGIRFYFLTKYDLSKKLTIWFRYAQTTYTDRDVISEGSLNEIDGNTKSEIKFQIRYKF